MKYAKLIFTLTVWGTALLGDYIVFKSKYSSSQLFRALTDSFVHGSIGFLSSLIFFSYEMKLSYSAIAWNVAICTVVSSLIDIDHAIAAGSFNLKDMTSLRQRGFLHCTTLWLLITIHSFAYSYLFKKLNIYLLTYMLLIAFTSHHVRDASRRGIWFYPFGHTDPLNYYFYVFLVCFLPNLFGISYGLFADSFVRHKTVIYDYKLLV